MHPIRTGSLLVLVCVAWSAYLLQAAPPDEQPTAVIIGDRRVTTPPPERMDQPPIAGVEALQGRAESKPALVMRGPFVSVQVNVNASGNNIVGDASNEPTIAINPMDPNRIAIAWRHFNTVDNSFRQAGHAYSLDGGATWTFPGVLDPGQFRSDPVLDSDANGSFYWSSLSSTTTAEVFKSLDSGVTWGPEVPAFGGDKQWLAVDDRPSGMGAGHVYQNWNVQFTCCPPNDFTRSINGAASFQSPRQIPLPSMKWGTNDVGPDGTLYIAGSTLGQDGHLVTRSSNAKDPGVLPTFDFVNSVNLGGVTGGFGGDDPNPGGLLGQVWIAADPSDPNRVYMLGSVVPPSGNPLDVMFVRSTDRGQTWSAPVRVNDDPASGAFHWFGTMSVAPNGRIDVVWNDTRNSGVPRVSELYTASSIDGGLNWTVRGPLTPMWDSHAGWPQQNKIGDYYHMISDNAGASLAFAATFNLDPGRCTNEQDVYFMRIPAPSSNDVISDEQNVASGALGDSHPSDSRDVDESASVVADVCDGACCQCDGTCAVTSSLECALLSGFFLGGGTSCDGVVCGAPNDFCSSRTILPSSPAQSIPFNTGCASTDGPSTIECGGSNPIGSDIWYQYVAPCTGTVRVSLCGTTNFDSFLAVYGGGTTCSCAQTSTSHIACGDDTCGVGGGPSVVTFSAIADRCYLIRVAGWNASTGAGVMNVSYDTACDLTPPTPTWDCPGGDLGSNSCVARTRALTFTMVPPPVATGSGGSSAIQITMTDLQTPDPPNNVCCPPPDFSEFESATCTATGEGNACARWVGPPFVYFENMDAPFAGTYRLSRLQCTPYYHDWAAEPIINVKGAGILPSSTYSVRAYGSDCKGAEEICANVSPAVVMKTRRAGDLVSAFAPTAPGQPNSIDIVMSVNNFKASIGSPGNVVAQIQPNVAQPPADFNALDIVAVVNYFKLNAYEFSGPCACPSTVPCDFVACSGTAQCVGVGAGALCVRTCAPGSPREGQPCTADRHCGTCVGGSRPDAPCGSNGICSGGTCTLGTCTTQGFCRDACARCSP